MNSSINYTLKYLLDKRQPMLQFSLLKYLKYEDLVKLMLGCKNLGRFGDANKA